MTLERIRFAAKLDEKSLTESTIKIGEELGELCQAVLIREQADGTSYREPVSDEKLAEEMADVIICVVALAEKYQIPDGQLDKWLNRKISKWLSVIRNGVPGESEDAWEEIAPGSWCRRGVCVWQANGYWWSEPYELPRKRHRTVDQAKARADKAIEGKI